MRKLFFCLLLCIATEGFSQESVSLSLASVELPAVEQEFTIAEVIDGRKNKASIGWLQTGIYNKARFATLEKPLEEEIGNFLNNTVISGGDFKIALRINHLHIREQSGPKRETARAEIQIDYFHIERNVEYYYITSTYSFAESNSLDVTFQHPKNIGKAVINGLDQFSQTNWKDKVNRIEIYSRDNLMQGVKVEPDLSELEILNCTRYRDGIFKTFQDFLNNTPSIVSDYEVKEGNNVRLWLLVNGKKEKINEGIYGFAHENKLYILFNEDFYLLRKAENTFYFTGPHIPDGKAIFKGASTYGLIGGAVAASTTGGNEEYKIDMTGGFIIGSHGL